MRPKLARTGNDVLDRAVTGSQLEKLTDDDLTQTVKTTSYTLASTPNTS